MRLVTYQDDSGVHVGALRDDTTVVSLDAVAPSMLALIDGGDQLLAQARAALERGATTKNYVEHAYESMRAKGLEPSLPPHPVFFTKAATTVCGPEDDIPLDPRVTEALDYEVELAYIIGRGGKNIARGDAMSHIFGYTIVNDISARDLQNRHQQFYKGKSLDRSCAMGPYIVTADEIPDPSVLGLRLRLNGETRQDSTVGDLIFDIPTSLEVLSLGQTIEPGTVVSTGTPSGVGMGFNPPKYMQAGDVMEAEIDRLGVLRNRVVAAE